MFGKHHFIAFCDSTWCVDEIKAGWEITSGLTFSESKMATKMADMYNCGSILYYNFCYRCNIKMIMVSKCMFLRIMTPILQLLYQLGVLFIMQCHMRCQNHNKRPLLVVTSTCFSLT